MKKIFKYSAFAICMILLGNIKTACAKEIKSTDITESTYVIGECMFTREVSPSYSGVLSTDVIMLASKTIQSNKLSDMIIYYKNARGNWINALTNNSIEIPESFNIVYKNNELYLDTPTLEIVRSGASGDSKRVPNLQNGMYSYDLAIDKNIYGDSKTGYSVNGYAIYEKTTTGYNELATYEITGAETVEVKVEAGKKTEFVARVYYLNASNEKVYSDYSNVVTIDHTQLTTPTLENASTHSGTGEEKIPNLQDGVYSYDLAIDSSDYIDELDNKSVTGCELYVINGNKYDYLKDLSVNGTAPVLVEVGTKGEFVARVYALNSKGEKVYSDYSNVVTINHTQLTTPTLENASTHSGTGEEKIPNLQDGVYSYDLAIDGSNYIDEFDNKLVTGCELYAKNGNKYEYLKDLSINGTTSVLVEAGTKGEFVARVYALNSKGEKVYSDYSNIVTIDHTHYEKPTIHKNLVSSENNIYTYDIGIDNSGYFDDNDNKLISGFDVYVKNGDEYEYVATGVVGGVITIEVEAGKSKTIVANVYAINSEGDKICSEFSDEVVIDGNN